MIAGVLVWSAITAGPAVAQGGTFVANLSGAQEVPPNGSAGTGFGRVTLNQAETQITASVYFSGLGSIATAGHIHAAPPAMNGAIQFNLIPPAATSGQVVNRTFAITPAQVVNLKAGHLYINIHTNSSPGGEIRGQLDPSTPFTATLNGGQEVPATSSTATGTASVSLNAAKTQALVSIDWTGLTGNASAAHVHSATAGTNGPIICDLSPAAAASGSVVDKLCPLTAPQATALESDGLYINVHSAMFPDGEIRGQLQLTDTLAPETFLNAAPQGVIPDRTPTFEFRGAEPDSTFECSIDQGTPAFASCSGPGGSHTPPASLADGAYTFRVRATDVALNVDPTPATADFTVDATPPDTSITSPDPAAGSSTNEPMPSFAFTASEAGATFECGVDASPFGPCSSPFNAALTDGSHTFQVRATDQVGNTDASPASSSFTVDTKAPKSKIKRGPKGETTDSTPTFRFKSNEAESEAACKLDRKPFRPCRSPKKYKQLKPGDHKFEVGFTDAAGNGDRTPAARRFEVVR